MIKRYSRNLITKIWSEESKYLSWLKIEILVLEGLKKNNFPISQKFINKLKDINNLNVNKIKLLEKNTKHDVVAFTRFLSELFKNDKDKKWIHYGLTSSDIVDTAQNIRLNNANKIIIKDLNVLINTLKKLAIKHWKTFQIGRTHGVHAEITTFGYTLALWMKIIKNNLNNFNNTVKNIKIAKISGAVGNFAHISPNIEEFVAKKLNFYPAIIASQIIPRDIYARYINEIAIIASTLDQFSINLRNLQRTEINEIRELFIDKMQKGSSAMPHKKNPISLENISGLSRIIRSYIVAANENIMLWHERDISNSSVERIMFPDITILIDYMLNKFNKILNNLQINKKKMLTNIYITNEIVFSQKVLLYLINKKNYSREKAYDIVQNFTIQSTKLKKKLSVLLLEKNILKNEEIQKIFSLPSYLKNIQIVFKKLKIF